MKKRPKFAAGVTGSVITAIRRPRCPRGSRQRPVLRSSRCSWNHCRFSAIVFPGSRPRPLVKSRIPIPAVWKSMVPITRSARIGTSAEGHETAPLTPCQDPAPSLHGHALREVAGLVRIVAPPPRQIVAEQLGGNCARDRRGPAEMRDAHVLVEGFVRLRRHADDPRAAR